MNILIGLFLLISSVYCFCTFDDTNDPSEDSFHIEKIIYAICGMVLVVFLVINNFLNL